MAPAGRDRRTSAGRRHGLAALALLAPLLGYAIPRWLVRPGLDRYAADPAQASVAALAYEQVWILNDNPIGRLLFPGARVQRVWRDPGHCPRGEPGGREPYADYRAEARTLGWFGVPGPTVHVRCGGWSSAVEAPRR